MKKSIIKNISLGIACLLGAGGVVTAASLMFDSKDVIEVRADDTPRSWSHEEHGEGTSSSPYLIYTTDDLYKFRDIVNGDNGETKNVYAYANLMQDITFEGTNNWTTNFRETYQGTFQGFNHSISGLDATFENTSFGFFSTLKGTIRDLTIKDSKFIGTGPRFGVFCHTTNYSSAQVYNCYSVNNTIIMTIENGESTNYYVGGIVGYVDDGIVQKCSNNSDITLNGTGTNFYVGGIVGYALTMSCYDCFNIGTINTNNSAAHLGGIIGGLNTSDTNYVRRVFSRGHFTFPAGAMVGAVFGTAKATYTSSTYYLNDGTGIYGIGGTTSDDEEYTKRLTAEEFSVSSNFQGFNFSMVWEIVNNSYPTFRNFYYVSRSWDSTNKIVVSEEKFIPQVTQVVATTTTLYNGWYIVSSDVTIDNRISVTGTVNLILCDGKTLTAKQGIKVLTGNTLNIYGQSGDTGKIIATSPEEETCIGGSKDSDGGSINIQGGRIEANIHSSNYSTGIGGSYERGFDSIEIYGGTVLATGSRFAPAIGSGAQHAATLNPGTITIYGGSVIATGGENAAAIGGGPGGFGESVTISGGSVIATGGDYASGIGIGGGVGPMGGTISITGGYVTATGGSGGAGIGGKTISISGGQINATGVGDGAGIGSGTSGSGPSVTISGGKVTATGGSTFSAGIGRSVAGGDHGTLTVTNGLPVLGGGSSESLTIKTAEQYADSRWQYMKVGNFHIHNFISYSASGNVITATCDNADGNCPLPEYKATLTISAPSGDLTYDGAAKEATYVDTSSGAAFSNITISYTKGGTPVVGSPIDAGTYVATISFNEDTTKTASIEYTISKADASLTAPTAKTGLVYTGSAQALVNAGSTSDGTIYYRLADGEYSTDIPTGINAGTYNVYYKLIGDNNHNNINETGPIEVTIDKADVTLTPPEGTIIRYDGDDHELVTSGSVTGGALFYKLGEGDYSTSIPTASNLGTYDIYYKVVGDSNHKDIAETGPIHSTITNAVAMVTNGETVTFYENFSDAVSAWNSADAGATLTLLKDVTVSSATTVSSSKILDLNGYGIRMTNTNTRIFNISSSGFLTVIDSNPSHVHAVALDHYHATSVSDGTGTTNVNDGTGTAYITGGYIAGSYSTSSSAKEGLAFYIDEGKLDLYGGAIIGNYVNVTNNCGAGVYMKNGATLKMYDGASFIYNYSQNSGAAIEAVDSYIEIYGGVIAHNKSEWGSGCAIAASGATSLKLYGGVIEDNSPKGAGAVSFDRGTLSASKYLGIKGSPVVHNNYSWNLNNRDANITLYTKINIEGPLTNTEKIGVNLHSTGAGNIWTNGSGVFTEGWSTYMAGKDPADYFFSDNPNYIIYLKDGEAYCGEVPAAKVQNGETITYYENFSDALAGWTENTTLTLLKDVTISENIPITFKRTLDLNGYGILQTGNTNIFDIQGLDNDDNRDLTIIDSNPTRPHAITLSNYRGTGVSDGTGTTNVTNGTGTAYITGGYLTGGNSSNEGGAIRVYNKYSQINITGGTFIGNIGTNGGAISLYSNSVSLTNINIIYNKATGGSGAIHNNNSTVTISDSNIQYNIGGEYTGGVFSGWDTNHVSIQGNTIINNNYVGTSLNNLNVENGYVKVSGELGEDAYIGITAASDNKVFTNSDNTSYNNASKFHADNINLRIYKNSDGQLQLTNTVAAVTDGTTVNEYSNIVDAIAAWNSASSGATLTLLKDVTISTAIVVTDNNNKVIDLNGFTLSNTGTNQTIVYVNGGTVTINGNGGTLCNGSGYSNGSYTRGGAIAVYADGTKMGNVTINDCNITNNSANFGGAIFVSKGTTATLNNCNVYNNNSSRIYTILGAIYVEDVGATVNVNGGEIYNNDAGIYLWGSSTAGSKANLNGVYIHDNDNYGVRVDGNDNGNPVLTIAGNTIIKNNSTLASPEAPGNIRINNSNNAKVAITSPLGENASLGVTLTNNTGVFTSGWSTVMGDAKPSDYFFSDNPNYSIYLKDGEACLGVGHTVTFNTNGRGIAPDQVIVDDGSLVNKPTDPTVEGYELKGWYKEAECENIWDFDNDTVTEDITLYALWDYDAATYNVINLINDIGTLTYDGGSNDSLADILAAKTAYDALTPGRKVIVDGVNKDILDHDITTYKNVDKVGDLINAIPKPSPDKSYYDAIDLAITEYNKLSEEEITILNSVINYQEFLNDNIAARKVIIEIEEIGEVTYDGGINDSKKDIEKAEKSYDELSEDQKDIVDYVNHDVLVDDREIYDQMAKAIKAIKEIGKVENNEETKEKIEEARKIYDSLPEELKDVVKNYDNSLKVLEDDEKVLDVLVLIDDIGDVNYDSASQEKILEARRHYDSLTDDQKRLIAPEVLEILEEKEATYTSINNTGISLLVVFLIISGLLLILGLIVMYFIIRKKKEDNGDDNNDNSANKSKTMKLASFTGIMPFIIYSSHYLDSGYILLYIIIALTVIVWLTNLVLFILKKKGLLNKKKEEVNPVETGKEPEPVNEEEEEEVVTITDEKGNIFNIRYIKSFTAKLIQSPDETKKYYEELKNYVLSYKKTTSRISWHYDSINSGRNQVLKFAIRGKTLCVYYPLNANDYEDSKYKVDAVESKKFEEVPCLYRIKNDRRLGYAKDLIDTVMTNLGLVKGEEQHEVYSDLPYEPNKPLIARGLIKEQKVQVNNPVEQVVSKKVNDDGDEIVTTRDAKGNIFEIRYIKSFTAKLSQASAEVKDYYNELKNYALGYKKANSRVSWHFDSINVGRNQVIKFSIRGKTLCVYYALNANDYLDTKYKVEVVESKKFEEVPCLYRIKNDRRRDYAKDLIDTVMANVPTEKGKESNEDFHIPYESTKALLAKGLIKESKVQVNKPVEDKPVEQMSEDEEEVITITDEKGNIFNIRYIKSFTAKLIQSPDETKKYYEELKNYVLSYKKTTSRVSWHYDSINSGRNQVIKFSIRGKTLCVYYALNANDYEDSKYKVEAVDSKKFEEVPCLYRIKNDRRLGYAKDLIDTVMSNLGLVKGEEQHEVYSNLPYEPNAPLIARGLIKELKVQVNKPVAPVVIKAEEVDAKMSDEEATSKISENVESKRHHGKKGIINIDVIARDFNNNEVVNIEALWKKKIISTNIGHVKVLARGSLDKKLHFELQDYSLQAVKMILLVGGTVKKVK